MAELAWERAISSDLFTFVIGPEKKEFTVHSGYFTALSPYFKTLIKGNMAEANDKRAIWDDIEVDAFLVLSQYAYTKNYFASAKCFTGELGDAKKNQVAVPAKNSNAKAEAKLRTDFNDRLLRKCLDECVTDGGSILPYPKFDTMKPREGFAKFVDFMKKFSNYEAEYIRKNNKPTMLNANVKTYVLADRFCIDLLRQSAFRNACCALASWTVNYDSVAVMRPIVRYVFENTRESDDLQKAFIDWGCCVCEAAGSHPEWKATLLDTPAFAAGILVKIVG